MKRDATMPDAEVTFDWMVENMPWIIGSPEDVHPPGPRARRGGRRLRRRCSFNSREWVTIDRWNRSLELFARYVTPAFKTREHQTLRRELAQEALGGWAACI